MATSFQLIDLARAEHTKIGAELRKFERLDKVMTAEDAKELVRMLGEVRNFMLTPVPEDDTPVPF